MEQGKLKTAILGVKDDSGNLADIASQSEHFEVAAIADKDTETAKQTAKQYDCQWFDDYRQMVINCQLDCILVAAGFYSCHQYVRLAMEKGISIFKLHPPAADYAQCAEFFQLADENKVLFDVSVPLRYSGAFSHFVSEYRNPQQDCPFTLITADCVYAKQSRPAWRSDPELAGGGVLLAEAYEVIDFLVNVFGLPEQVYCRTTNNAQDKQQRNQLAEDTAALIMKYSNDLTCNVIARRITSNEQTIQNLNCFVKDTCVSVSQNAVETKTSSGRKIKKKTYKDDPARRLGQNLNNFAKVLTNPQDNKLVCTQQGHLDNMAVIAAAYLSAKTQMPEEPQRIKSIKV